MATFEALKWQGRALVDLHVNNEQVVPYAKGTASCLEAGADATDLQATKLKHGKIASKKGNTTLDKPKLVYNRHTISGLLLQVHVYVVKNKSALE